MNHNIHHLRRPSSAGIKYQRGWTLWSILFVLGTILFFAYVGMQLVPVYSANSNVVNAMKVSVEGKNLRTIGRAQIIKSMQKQLYLDGMSNLIDYKKQLKVSRNKNRLLVQADYERKIPLFFNISVAADFAPKVECALGGTQCTATSF